MGMKDKEWGAIEIKIKEFERNQKFSEDAYFFHLLYKECTSLRAEVERLKKQSELQSDVMSERGIRIRQLEEAVEWACARFLETPRSLGFNFDVKELRRKAGM